MKQRPPLLSIKLELGTFGTNVPLYKTILIMLISYSPMCRSYDGTTRKKFGYLESYPHHHHDELGNVKASPLQGDPVKDIELVLQEVSAFLSRERT